MATRADTQMHLRLPADLRHFLAAQARRNGTSLNAEVQISIRERMDRAPAIAASSTRNAEHSPEAARSAA